jgi:hypothetical protein
MRMGLRTKAVTHLAVGGVETTVLITLFLLLPSNVRSFLGLAVNLGILYYLQNQTEKDITAFEAHIRDVQNAHWLGGCLIGLFMFGLFLTLATVVVIFLTLVGVRIPK